LFDDCLSLIPIIVFLQALIPAADQTFMRIQFLINFITFPIGMLSAGWLVGTVTRATQVDIQARLSGAELSERRRRCLEPGNMASIVGLTLWLVAAPAYPILLHWLYRTCRFSCR
jgi:hypothetical protein